MTHTIANPCIRCGKERVVIETTKEYLGESLVVTTTMACPDKECQQLVDAKFEKEKVAREKLNINPHPRYRGKNTNNSED